MGSTEKKHFILVHGSGLGAWSWYKLIALLKEGGHRVTALDLGGCGRNPKQLADLASFYDYIKPLTDFMTSLADDEKVILVGHSYGGFVIALTTESFSDKILSGVYVTAFMPNTTDPPATLQERFFRITDPSSFLDSKIWYDDGQNNPPTAILFGPNYAAVNFYQNSPPEDLELGRTMQRPNGFFLGDLGQENLLTEKKYGSVKRVFVSTGDDRVLQPDFQKYMIENSPPDEVKAINGADHLVMSSKPKQLYQAFLEIAKKY